MENKNIIKESLIFIFVCIMAVVVYKFVNKKYGIDGPYKAPYAVAMVFTIYIIYAINYGEFK